MGKVHRLCGGGFSHWPSTWLSLRYSQASSEREPGVVVSHHETWDLCACVCRVVVCMILAVRVDVAATATLLATVCPVCWWCERANTTVLQVCRVVCGCACCCRRHGHLLHPFLPGIAGGVSVPTQPYSTRGVFIWQCVLMSPTRPLCLAPASIRVAGGVSVPTQPFSRCLCLCLCLCL
jgi:hypothetical protein